MYDIIQLRCVLYSNLHAKVRFIRGRRRFFTQLTQWDSKRTLVYCIPGAERMIDLNRVERIRWSTQGWLKTAVSCLCVCGLNVAASGADLGNEDGPVFVEVDVDFPNEIEWRPPVPVAPPAGSSEPIYDNFDNYWTLAPADEGDYREVLVLPAQDRSAWISPGSHGLEPGNWLWMQPDEHGYVWVASARQVLRFDPRFPQRGWHDFSLDSRFPAGRLTSLSVGPRGSMLVAVDSGYVVELDRQQSGDGGIVRERNRVRAVACLPGVTRMRSDKSGRVWLQVSGKVYRASGSLFDLSDDATEEPFTEKQDIQPGQHWELVARMPGSNHDLSGDVLNGKFYVAGGLTNGWGYPARDHDFSKLLEFDGQTAQWRIAADLSRGRVYCATSHLDGKVWVVGGDVFLDDRQPRPNGTRIEMDWVQIVDPATGEVTDGPPLACARPMPIALHVGGRIYVAGNPRGQQDQPGRVESIGHGEKKWRREPNGPAGFGPLAGCALGDQLYLAVPERFLAVFDTRSQIWTTIEVPHPPRSCQMASFAGEVWLMGGQQVPNQSEVQIYNPATRQWRNGPALPRGLSWGAAADVGGKLIVTGGAGRHANDYSYNNRTWALSP